MLQHWDGCNEMPDNYQLDQNGGQGNLPTAAKVVQLGWEFSLVIYPGSTPVGNATLVVANVLTCNKYSHKMIVSCCASASKSLPNWRCAEEAQGHRHTEAAAVAVLEGTVQK
jgi:hypothetical protein